MTSLRVSATQMPVTNNVTRKVTLLRDAIRQAQAAQADILLTGEGPFRLYA
jgi:predicted amidohydrolase